MKKKRYTPQQISAIHKELEQGKRVEVITREHGVGRTSFYKRCKRYGGDFESFNHRDILNHRKSLNPH